MKAIKKLLSIVMVLTLVLSLGASALAAEGTTHSITITGPHDANSTYNAYKLLTAEYVRTDSSGDVYDYHINTKYSAAIKAGLDAVYTGEDAIDISDEPAVIDAISRLRDVDGAPQKFANAVYMALGTATPEGSVTVTADKVGEDAVIANVDGGYYMIAETVDNGTNSAVTSLVMLDTAGNPNASVTVKEDRPTSEKKLKDRNDEDGSTTGWQDGADWDIGDDVPYKLTAKLQDSHFGDYDYYYLQFQDDMSAGLTYNDDAKITVNGTDITSYFTHTTGTSAAYTGGTMHYWTCLDIKTIPGVAAGCEIVVEYTAKLNNNAVIGKVGNPNQSCIEFSNNPYNQGNGTGKPDTGHTPWDKVIVFTFDMDVSKVDGVGDPLDGAGFTLYKKTSDGTVNLDDHDGNWTQIGHYAAANDLTEFYFKGLDDGTYCLVETEIPEGFNKADDIVFKIVPVHNDNDPEGGEAACTGLKVVDEEGNEKDEFEIHIDAAKDVITTTVTNLTGLELPSTGGIGTTIFYVIGAVLVAAAVVLLVTKKRVNGAEK